MNLEQCFDLKIGTEKEDTKDKTVEFFEPKDIDIVKQTMVISNIVERLRNEDIILDPDFQRLPGLWNKERKSRLIESLMVRIPLPSFYFDFNFDEDKYTVVDGLQRLQSIKEFIVLSEKHPDKLHLSGLEYMQEYEGCTFEDLPVSMQRRIKEQEIMVYVIRAGTPENVKNNIFKRINTGGMVLTQAEIRNALYRGRAAQFLKQCAESSAFVKVTNNKVLSKRMMDRELVNRFLAFYILDISEYKENLEQYLNLVLRKVRDDLGIDTDGVYCSFVDAMELANDVFGKIAFRKKYVNGRYGSINKPLFECVSVVFANLVSGDKAELRKKKDKFMSLYDGLLSNKEFVDAITQGTASLESVQTRHKMFKDIVMEAIRHD